MLVVFGDERSDEALAAVHALFFALEAARPAWLLDVHPAYASILVEFDLLQADADAVVGFISALPVAHAPARAPRTHVVPVHYGSGTPCDLDDVARTLSLSPAEVIALHSASRFSVAFLGFMPGFAYLTGLDPRLTVPRRPAPRALVARGSVAIAAGQAAVYPDAGPGGWHLLGVTDVDMRALGLLPGDAVRFEAAS